MRLGRALKAVPLESKTTRKVLAVCTPKSRVTPKPHAARAAEVLNDLTCGRFDPLDDLGSQSFPSEAMAEYSSAICKAVTRTAPSPMAVLSACPTTNPSLVLSVAALARCHSSVGMKRLARR